MAKLHPRAGGGIGRRTALKMQRPYGHRSSILLLPTSVVSLWITMNQRLKRWESPRQEGRNDRGRGGSARARQLRKRSQMLRQKLKEGGSNENNRKQGEEKLTLLPVFLLYLTFAVGIRVQDEQLRL